MKLLVHFFIHSLYQRYRCLFSYLSSRSSWTNSLQRNHFIYQKCGRAQNKAWNSRNFQKLIKTSSTFQELNQIQRLFKTTACHATPLPMELHWLLFDQCIIFKLLLLVFISLHNLAPLCINELLYRFSVEVVILDPQTYADRAFFLWQLQNYGMLCLSTLGEVIHSIKDSSI